MNELAEKTSTMVTDEDRSLGTVAAQAVQTERINLYMEGANNRSSNCGDSPELDHEFWFNRGVELATLNRYQEAMDCFDYSLAIESRNYKTWIWRGGMLTHLDRYQEASASFEQAVKLEPNAKDAWLFLGVAFHHIGKYKQAYSCYDKALGRKPDPMREAMMRFESLIKRVIAGIFKIKVYS
jgi:tetratricopeptide (TPR) repeat protein